ncbi:17011_t:CDS:2 [Acaulospora colombiana]|uniref:17011_t:CDS:1 n=1 Tax=Acaulospora colombiana TaxID=27376 RepID=A0ACA9KZY4_9GLOM|nr:17011_t:CDS:2 [Acaulospora colombiana]
MDRGWEVDHEDDETLCKEKQIEVRQQSTDNWSDVIDPISGTKFTGN